MQKKAKSPYCKYDKYPFRYSDLYYRWRAAIKSGKEAEARRLDAEHKARFSNAN